MAKVKSFVVASGAVVLKTVDGQERYLYKDAPVVKDAFDADSFKRAVKIGLVAEIETEVVDEAAGEEGFKGVSVADLKAEIEKRNTGREGDKKIVPAEPGNRPELVAALVADDAAQQS